MDTKYLKAANKLSTQIEESKEEIKHLESTLKRIEEKGLDSRNTVTIGYVMGQDIGVFDYRRFYYFAKAELSHKKKSLKKLEKKFSEL
jgi:hypothetical protein